MEHRQQSNTERYRYNRPILTTTRRNKQWNIGIVNVLIISFIFHDAYYWINIKTSLISRFMGQHGAHLGPTGPRWAPYWPHEPCYLWHDAYRLLRGFQIVKKSYRPPSWLLYSRRVWYARQVVFYFCLCQSKCRYRKHNSTIGYLVQNNILCLQCMYYKVE